MAEKKLNRPQVNTLQAVDALYKKVKARIKRSIKLQILFATGAALLISMSAGLFVRASLRQTDLGRRSYITYEESRNAFNDSMIEILIEINGLENTAQDSSDDTRQSEINNILSRLSDNYRGMMDIKHYLADSKGELISQDDYVQSINLIKVIQKVNNRENIYRGDNAFAGIYPITLNNEICYLFLEGVLVGQTRYYYNGIPEMIGFITGLGVFILLIFKFTKYKIDYIEYISHCLGEISKGNLSYQVEVLGSDELAKVAEDITYMEGEIKKQIKAKLRTEKLKNELVTNVAHDLRTPLTSVIGYINLLKNKQFKTEEEAGKYIDIAYSKAESLKVLIEDLFELAKLQQEGLKLTKEPVSMTNLIQQLAEELLPLVNEKNIKIQMELQVKKPTVLADIPKLTRAIENIIENAIKYSPKESIIYIELRELQADLFFAVSNRCENIEYQEVERLFDRFYRTDQSRNSQAGGSGLGLAIAKDIIALHGGTIKAKLKGNLISFMMKLPKMKT